MTFSAALQRNSGHARDGALGSDGDWVMAAISAHLAGEVPLDQALTRAFGNICRHRRDQVLREFADRYCCDPILSRKAAQLANEITRYLRGTWRHDRHRPEIPPPYIGTPRELLFVAFSQNEAIRPYRDMPSSVKQLMKIILGANGNDPPIPISESRVSDASNDGDQDEGERVHASAQWRQKSSRR
jgi:hypothetical protein